MPQNASPRPPTSESLFSSAAAQAITGPGKLLGEDRQRPFRPEVAEVDHRGVGAGSSASFNAARVSFSFSMMVLQRVTGTPARVHASPAPATAGASVRSGSSRG